MSNYKKLTGIKKIAEDLLILSETDFENIGHKFLCYKEQLELNHTGINMQGRPIKGNVDSISFDGKIIAEYSVDEKYFDVSNSSKKNDSKDASTVVHVTYEQDGKTITKSLHSKIFTDLEHAISYGGTTENKTIYLLSNRQCSGSFRDCFYKSNEITNAQLNNEIKIYDLQLLSEQIYDLCEKYIEVRNEFKNDLEQYRLFINLYTDYEIPAQCSYFVNDSEIINKIKGHYQNGNKICILYGISGSGKSSIAKEFALEDSRTAIWMDGQNFNKETIFTNITKTAASYSNNIEGFFNAGNILLILDNITCKIEESYFSNLSEGFEKNSIILCTSQLFNNEASHLYLPMPSFSEFSVRKILNESLSSRIPNELITIGKTSPLTLSFIRGYVQHFNPTQKHEFYKTITKNLNQVQNANAEALIKKIIETIDDKCVIEALTTISNMDCSFFDIEFLKSFINEFTIYKLRLWSILIPTETYNVLKIHDLMKNACTTQTNVKDYFNKLSDYIKKNKGEMSTSVLHQIYISRKQLEDYKKNRKKSYWLDLACIELDKTMTNKVVKKYKRKSLLLSINFGKIQSIIDSQETFIYSLPKHKKNSYCNYIKVLYVIKYYLTFNNDIKIYLLHHIGKILKIQREYIKSYDIFKKVLAKDNSSFHSMLQITMLKDIDKIEKLSYLKQLLEAVSNDSDNKIHLRTKLSLISVLRNYKNDFSKESYLNVLTSILKESYADGEEQFYEAFSSFISLYYINAKDSIKDLIISMPTVLTISPGTYRPDSEVNIMDSLSTIYGLDILDSSKKEIIYKNLQKYCERMISLNIPNKYLQRAIIKTYNLIGDLTNAINYAKTIELSSTTDDFFILFWIAKSYLDNNDYSNALTNANKQLDIYNSNTKKINNLFLYDCLIQNGNIYFKLQEFEKSLIFYTEAYSLLNDSDFRKKLLLEKINNLP